MRPWISLIWFLSQNQTYGFQRARVGVPLEKHYLFRNQGGSKLCITFQIWSGLWVRTAEVPFFLHTHTHTHPHHTHTHTHTSAVLGMEMIQPALGRLGTLNQGCGCLCVPVDKSLFLKKRVLISPSTLALVCEKVSQSLVGT